MGGPAIDGVVEVAGGRVRGREVAGGWTFTGVPYARSPEGPLRWRPPLPPEPWAGVRDATVAGAVAPQSPPVPGLAVPGDPFDQREDCLQLNVWTPAPDDGQRPVMVWVHGGGFTGGAGSSALYTGAGLALRGDVVVVTINYRLGALGFLAHPALTDRASGACGNWGLLDQVAALRWVRDHIRGFGGDPGNVTVFGESAGGMSVSALLAMPVARGLFHKAIVQSGPPYTHRLARAVEVAEEMVAELGLGEVSRDRLETVPASDLVAAAGRLQGRPARPAELPLLFLPVEDGASLPRPPLDAVADGDAAGVPLLVGTNREELAFFVLADPRRPEIGDEQLGEMIARTAPEATTPAAVAAYRSARQRRSEPVAARDLWVAAGSDLVFRLPTLRLAAAHHVHQPATFVYLFTWAAPAFGGVLGSCHGLEVPFVFGTVGNRHVAAFAGGGPEAESLSADVQDAWVAFARGGDPSHPAVGRWPAWDPSRRATMVLGRRREVVDGPLDEELAAWGPLTGTTAAAGGAPGPGGGAGNTRSTPSAEDGDVAQLAEAGRLNRLQ